jgi:hypothetical protein
MDHENWNLDDDHPTIPTLSIHHEVRETLGVVQKALVQDAELVTSVIFSLNIHPVDCNTRN